MKGSAEDHLHRRWRAEAAISRRVKEGKLPKASTLKCVDCGRKADHYDHFKGHQHELAVEPVCASCHQKREYKRGVLKLNHHHPSFIAGQKRSGKERGREARIEFDREHKGHRIGTTSKDGRTYRKCLTCRMERQRERRAHERSTGLEAA